MRVTMRVCATNNATLKSSQSIILRCERRLTTAPNADNSAPNKPA